MFKLKLYLAGKIGKNDWRHSLVPSLRGHRWKDGPIEMPDYLYMGPFFVSDDHGGNHGPHSHGAIGKHLLMEPTCTAMDVIRNNNSSLEQADLVFAYITEIDCYGTLIEIGSALRAGQRVVIAFEPGIPHHDFWYGALQATSIYHEVCECCLAEILAQELKAMK